MNGTTDKAPFDPTQHLVSLKGRAYLEVKHRVQWFRSVHPEGRIDTELVEHRLVIEEKEVQKGSSKQVESSIAKTSYALAKASVYLHKDDHTPVATDYGMEEKGDFQDYPEKSVTKAVGRALAQAGYGTQFCDDLDFGSADGKVVDAPVQQPKPFTF